VLDTFAAWCIVVAMLRKGVRDILLRREESRFMKEEWPVLPYDCATSRTNIQYV
jgi:hypothetical protein